MSHDVDPRPDMCDINPRSAKTISRADYDDDHDLREPPMALPSWSWMGIARLCIGGVLVAIACYGLARLFVSIVNP